MAKTSTQFVCQGCGATASKWSGRCPDCGAWNSYIETQITAVRKSSGGAAVAGRPETLASVDIHKTDRIKTSLGELDQVLGGGLVPGSVMLLSGDPGIGKSTLVLQLAAVLAATKKILYVSGEESSSQIKLRAERLGVAAATLELLTETSTDTIAATLDTGGYDLVIIDSIQTLATDSLAGAPGSVGQITASAQMLQAVAKRHHTALLIIGHVTKEGQIAGPKILEHLVDVVLYFEGEKYGSFKVLRGIKNRFGSTSEAALFEMTDKGLVAVSDPSSALLAERQEGPGSVVLATLEGSRPVLVEVQALVNASSFGYPKRTAAGFDLNRLNVLVAVLTKRAGLALNDQDIYVNIVGGLKIVEPAADLAIILAIASAFKNQPIKPGLVAFGEVGLSGEIRSVSQVEKRLLEAKKMGFSGAIGPRIKTSSTSVSGVSSVSAALDRSF